MALNDDGPREMAADWSTRASTTGGTENMTSSTTQTQPFPLATANAAPQPARAHSRKRPGPRRHQSLNRRRMSPFYYYDDAMPWYDGENFNSYGPLKRRKWWRRMDYENPFGPASDAVGSTNTSTPEKTKTNTAFTTQKSVTETLHTSSTRVTTASTTPALKKPSATATKLSLKVTKDPILSQVASEIINELEDSRSTHTTYRTALLKKVTTRAQASARQTYVATFKIHLQHSTRYPIPLPENHAFCFTNPENALCRTFIR